MLLLSTVLSGAAVAAPAKPCIPIASDRLAPTSSALVEHKALRDALGEPMPEAPTRVMLHGRGGHLATDEYSIVLARGTGGIWRGSLVGRSQIWVTDAPYSPYKRRDWVLDRDKSRELDAALARRCPFDRSAAATGDAGPPPRGYISEVIDVLQPGRAPVSYYVTEGDGIIASLIRPPR